MKRPYHLVAMTLVFGGLFGIDAARAAPAEGASMVDPAAASASAPDVAEPASGQPPLEAQQGAASLQDPPARVGRLAAIDGLVSQHAEDANAWEPASRNYPITGGTSLWSDNLAKAEVQVGTLAVRLSAKTLVLFNRLDDRSVQMGLAAGALVIHVRALGKGELLEVDTPQGSVTLQQRGSYRIEMDAEAHVARAIVRQGQAEILLAGRSVVVAAGQAAQWSAAANEGAAAAPQLGPAPTADEFDAWCLAREQRVAQAPALQHLSPATVGYEDLDEYGSWGSSPAYGPLWRPRSVPVGWAPYHDGHWAYVAPWGWTWIDDAPWGFAPFHYGRWVNDDGGWAWMPGSLFTSPCYAPALVAFAGAGVGVGVVTWFALGPREIYVPAYRSSYGYVRGVNVGQVSIRHGTSVGSLQARTPYINRTVPGAIAQVPRSVLLQGRGVGAYRLGPPSPGSLEALRPQSTPNLPRPSSQWRPGAATPPPGALGGRVAAPIYRRRLPPAVGPRTLERGWAPARPSARPLYVQPGRLPSPLVMPRPASSTRPPMAPAGHYFAPRPSYTGGHFGGGRRH